MKLAVYACLTTVALSAPDVCWAGPGIDMRMADNFTLKAKVLESLEGGPVIVRLTLVYRGPRPIELPNEARDLNGDFNVLVSPPESWRERATTGRFLIVVGRSVTWTIRPNEELVSIVYLHHGYENIPSEQVNLKFTWLLHSPYYADCYEPPVRWEDLGKPEPMLKSRIQAVKRLVPRHVSTSPSVSLSLNVLPATRERIRVLSQAMEERWDAQEPPGGQLANRREVIESIRFTTHPGLAPFVWRLIEHFPSESPVYQLLPQVYASGSREATNHRLVKLACNPSYHSLDDIFSYWRRERTPLSTEEMAPLLQSDNVWTRASAYLVFPDQCGTAWVDQMFHDLRAVQQPLPAERFARLLSDLDDDDFTVRERATHHLQQQGEPVRSQLVQVLEGQPTLEVKARVQRVLEAIAKGPPGVVRTTLWLADNGKEAEALLRLLAKGEPDSWVVKEAKAILARHRK